MRAVKQLIGVFAALIAFWVSNKKRAEESARFFLLLTGQEY